MFQYILLNSLIAIFNIVCSEQYVQSCPPLPPAVQLGDKCLWTMVGGNMSAAMEACRGLDGALLSFDSITEATQALDAVNISQDIGVFTSGVKNNMNGSLYYDWLNRPGTWSPDLDHYVTSFPMSDEQESKYICLVVVNETLAPSDCDSERPTTVCEKAITRECPCRSKGTVVTPQSTTPLLPEAAARAENYASSPAERSDDIVLPNSDFTVTSPAITQKPDATTLTERSQLSEHESTTVQSHANLSEISMSSILDHVMSHVINASHETEATTPLNRSSELILIPKNNGTMMISFENLLELVENKSRLINETEYHNQSSACLNQTTSTIVNETEGNNKPTKGNSQTSGGRPTFITGLFHRNHTLPLDFNKTDGALVREVPFQVSGLGTGSAHPMLYTEFPPLYSPGHVTVDAPEFIKNISESLIKLQQKTSINEHDFQQLTQDVSDILDSIQKLSYSHLNWTKQFVPVVTFTRTFHQAVENDLMQAESVDMRKYLFMDILMVAERMVNNVGNPTMNITVKTDAIDITTKLIPPFPSNGTNVEVNNEIMGTEINLTNAIFDNYSSAVRISTVLYKKVGSLAEASSRHISSTVLSVSVQHITGNTTHEPDVSTTDAIVFTMETFIEKKRTENDRQCVFLNFSSRAWSTFGCHVASQNSTHTTCSCNHLTSFAILVMYVETDNISLETQQVLFTLTTVGCSLSIACLAMTLITYFYLKMLGREKIMIHANLCLALMLGQLVFVSSGEAYKHTDLCKAIAVTLHFLFMAAFTWMLVEGVALYLCCTRGIFNQRDMRCKYLLLGWGPPAVIVIVSVAAEFPDYGNGPQYSCWLSVHNGLIWAFLGPMIFIVSLNMLVMGLVVKVFLTLQTNTQKTEVARFRGSVRAMLTLLPLLGLTWITSLLVPYSVVFHYLFIIINTVQGMCIFFFHCICNDEIRQKFREKTKRWSSSRTGSDADVSNQQRRKTGSFDALKVPGGVAASPSSNSGQRSAWT